MSNLAEKRSPEENPLLKLESFGQSPWLDFIQRKFTRSGELKKLVDNDGLKGVTSNPSIFQKSIGEGSDYDEAIQEILSRGDQDANGIYEELAIQDIQDAADVLKPVYEKTRAKDGYVSLEVSPLLAMDGDRTLQEARRLWKRVNRPNVMIKVPGTVPGISAFRTLISEGINVNVTLLFSQDRHEEFMHAYLDALEILAEKKGDLSKIASVASFFVSRIDTVVDGELAKKIEAEKDPGARAPLAILMGQAAISNARLAYQRFQHVFSTSRWKKLALRGAHPQRVLWASTSAKNPSYPDTMYIDELIGNDTVNTIPQKTMDAFRDHGKVRATITERVCESKEILDDLEKAGISIAKVTDKLVTDGIKEFIKPFQNLLMSIEKKRAAFYQGQLSQILFDISDEQRKLYEESSSKWKESVNNPRLWDGDAALWTGKDEANWLGWLDIIDRQLKRVDDFKNFSNEVKAKGFEKIVVLGMGGSSLCPEVLGKTFEKPDFRILDSTDPLYINDLQRSIPLEKTLFIVSSKSGGTLEPNIFQEYFFDLVRDGSHFVAITDPGSSLEKTAKSLGFWKTFYGDPAIGGRYSALSDFGLVPAAAMGIDVERFLQSASLMEKSCSRNTPAESNPGVSLGLLLGSLALAGKNKVTFICGSEISDLGAWLEQLIAESTGKEGKGLIPVAKEELGAPNVYGNDRVFVSLSVGKENPKTLEKLRALRSAGHPVVHIELPHVGALGQEFFRWEIATAVAGSVIGINPFDQPDVEASKIETKKLTAGFEKTGELPTETPIFEENDIRVFVDPKNAQEIRNISGDVETLEGLLGAHFSRIRKGDYVALLPYLAMTKEHESEIERTRILLRDRFQVASCVGFGPRFLHSTGQAYKGGPNTGVFLQITGEDELDLPIPGRKFSFGVVKAAQAQGDLEVLRQRGRRVIRVHLGRNTISDLKRLRGAIEKGNRS
jgi:transaldolase/glucose-6-phosphate isomerase